MCVCMKSILRAIDYVGSSRKTDICGRGKGGNIIGIKTLSPCAKYFNFVEKHGKIVIGCVNENVKCYILPLYLNVSCWDNDFKIFSDFINEYSDFNYVIIGDVNHTREYF